MIPKIKLSRRAMALIASVVFLVQGGCSDHNQPTDSKNSMNMHHYQYEVQLLRLPSGSQIAYREAGQGEETLLMLHGLGSYLPVWNKVFPLLTPGFLCIAIDLPGYGKSDPAAEQVSIAYFASQIEAFIKELKLKNITLVGHSMGGQISIRVALNGLVDIDRLVLLAPAGIETFNPDEAAMLKKLVSPASIYTLTDSQIAQNFAINFYGGQLPEDARFMYEDRLRLKVDEAAYTEFSQLFAQSISAMLDGPIFESLPQLKLPVLVLFGENDLLIPNRYLHPDLTTQQIAELAEARIPGASIRMIPKCGHFIPWEQPERVSQAIVEFIADDKIISK